MTARGRRAFTGRIHRIWRRSTGFKAPARAGGPVIPASARPRGTSPPRALHSTNAWYATNPLASSQIPAANAFALELSPSKQRRARNASPPCLLGVPRLGTAARLSELASTNAFRDPTTPLNPSHPPLWSYACKVIFRIEYYVMARGNLNMSALQSHTPLIPSLHSAILADVRLTQSC